jgi:hypothetical protein
VDAWLAAQSIESRAEWITTMPAFLASGGKRRSLALGVEVSRIASLPWAQVAAAVVELYLICTCTGGFERFWQL